MRTHIAVAALGLAVVLAPRPAAAHCDTLDGPVVKDARVALEAKDEAEIREAFGKAVAVRASGGEAGALADRYGAGYSAADVLDYLAAAQPAP